MARVLYDTGSPLLDFDQGMGFRGRFLKKGLLELKHFVVRWNNHQGHGGDFQIIHQGLSRDELWEYQPKYWLHDLRGGGRGWFTKKAIIC